MTDQNPKLGEILVRAGVIDELQLDSALGEQSQWGHRLGVTLVKLGFLDEKDLIRALAHQLDLPIAGLDGKRIHPDVLGLIPYELAEKAMMLPLFVRDEEGNRVLYAGMADPCDLASMDDIRFRTGMQVKPVLIAPSELAEGIDRFYRNAAHSPGAYPHAGPPAEMHGHTAGEEDTASMAIEMADVEDHVSGHDAGVDLLEAAVAADAAAAAEAAAVASEASEGEGIIPLPGLEPAVVPHTAEVPAASPAAATTAANANAAAAEQEALSRVVVRALAQLLVEKGVLERGELQDRIRALEQAEAQAES